MKLKQLFIVVLLIALINATRFKKKRATQATQKNEWATDDSESQNCWAECTRLNGFACGFGDQGRWTSQFYQCNTNEQTCENWLDAFEVCRSTGCPGWRDSNLATLFHWFAEIEF
jgi:hypothetical protein